MDGHGILRAVVRGSSATCWRDAPARPDVACIGEKNPEVRAIAANGVAGAKAPKTFIGDHIQQLTPKALRDAVGGRLSKFLNDLGRGAKANRYCNRDGLDHLERDSGQQGTVARHLYNAYCQYHHLDRAPTCREG